MLRFMTLYKKRADMDYDTFRQEVMDVHVPMVAKLPGLKRYQQSFNVNWPPQDTLGYDGIAELWFETQADHANAMSQAQEPLAHAAEILDTDYLHNMVVEEHPITLDKDGAARNTGGLVRMTAFVNKRDDLSYDEYKRHLLEVHVPIVKQYPGLVRYQQNFNINWPPQDALGYDGTAELWFASMDDIAALRKTPNWEEGVQDAQIILNMDRLHQMIVREHPVALNVAQAK